MKRTEECVRGFNKKKKKKCILRHIYNIFHHMYLLQNVTIILFTEYWVINEAQKII